MKVLHLTTHLNIGGITTYIRKLGKPLRALDVEIAVLSGGGECVPQFRREGIKTFELPMKTKSELSPRLWMAAPKAKRIILEEKFDLIHAHTRATQVWAAFLGSATNVPVVTTCHGFYKRRLGRRILPAWGERVIAISDGVGEHLSKDFGLPASQIAVVNNGVDVDEIQKTHAGYQKSESKQSYGFAPHDPVIGVVARLVADKGHAFLIRALGILRTEFPYIRLLIVGDGRCLAELQELTRELELQDNVVFTGNVSNVVKPLSAMDIFVLPATWREGFGLSLAEAMVCSIPVITSNIHSLNTLIRSGETGILVKPGKADLLAETLRGLIRNPAEAKRLGKNGRRIVEEQFSLERMAAGIRNVYASVAATAGKL